MKYDTAKVGDRISWPGLNRTYHGIITSVTDQGVIAAIDGGGVMLLSTTHSIQWAEAERKRRQEENSKPRSTK